MDCPSCNATTRVLESRGADDGTATRRRRECPACGRRFTTFERREREPLFVLKRGGGRQRFDRAKLAGGLSRAAHKRPVEPAQVERVVARIEDAAEARGGEIESAVVGDMCLEGLRELDRIAYLQFAAVYKGFEDVGEFTGELHRLGVEPARNAGATSEPVPSGPTG